MPSFLLNHMVELIPDTWPMLTFNYSSVVVYWMSGTKYEAATSSQRNQL